MIQKKRELGKDCWQRIGFMIDRCQKKTFISAMETGIIKGRHWNRQQYCRNKAAAVDIQNKWRRFQMEETMTREQAWALLQKYNQEPFHLEHGLTLEGVMGWYAGELGYGEDAAFWKLAGLLHDIDFEQYPEQHCRKAPQLLQEAGASEELIHAVCSHGYGLVCDVKPEHEMEKVLFAVDELTGLIGAGVRMRPSKSVMDMEASSVKKKFKDKHFAAGCSRDVIKQGAEQLGWDLNDLFEKTILAMRSCEASVREKMQQWNGSV